MSTPRRRMYHVEATLEGDQFEVIRSVEGSPNTTVLDAYVSEVMAARVAMHLQSFANADYQMRFDALAKKANS